MTRARFLSMFWILSLTCTELSAKGGNYHMEDRYNPQHVDSLPPEIRNSILHRCSVPKALHSFATYSDGSKRIVLHFEHFVCDGDGTYCGPSGCLHQVWTLDRGHYHLVRSYHAPAGDSVGAW